MNKIYLAAIVSVTSYIIFSASYILYEKEGRMPTVKEGEFPLILSEVPDKPCIVFYYEWEDGNQNLNNIDCKNRERLFVAIDEDYDRKIACFNYWETNIWNDTTKTCNLRFLPDDERILN